MNKYKSKKKKSPTSCISQRLNEVPSDTDISVFIAGEVINLTLKTIEKGCIVGQTPMNTPIYLDCKKVIGFSLISEEEWILISPETSYPLPTDTAKINNVTFEAMTDPETTSIVSLTVQDFAIRSDSNITSTLKTISWELVATYPSTLLALKNEGISPIYIRKLLVA